MSIGNGLPEDAAPITRRAHEAAKVCLAIKADPANFQEWRSKEIRIQRWLTRSKGEKPKSFSPAYKNVQAEDLYEELQKTIAALSDFTVHFTPEHVLRYEWELVPGPGGRIDYAFGHDEDAIAKEFIMLVEQHRLILCVFDRCLDGKLRKEPAVAAIAERAMTLFKEMVANEFPESVAAVGENWWKPRAE
jgi:hypothetical protein